MTKDVEVRVKNAIVKAEQQVAEALEGKRKAEDARIESDKQATDALEAKQRAEKAAAEIIQKAKMDVEQAQKVAEDILLQQERLKEKAKEVGAQI